MGCYNGDRRLAAVTHGVEWALQQLSPESQALARSDDEEEEDDAATILPSLYSLVRLTLDPVRQDVLESLAPQLEAWKERCLVRAAAAGAAQGKGKGARWGQAALIGAFRRVVQLERLGVYAPKEAKRALVEGYVSGRCVRVCIYWADLDVWTSPQPIPHNPPKTVRKRDSGSKATSSSSSSSAPVWDVEDLLGWNPLTGPVPEGLPDPLDPQGRPLSRLALLARSLEWAALVELSGLVQGAAADEADGLEGEEGGGNNRALSAECRLLHVLKWLPAFRTCGLFFLFFQHAN